MISYGAINMKENKENLQIECDSSRDDAAYIDEIVSGQGNPVPVLVVSLFAAAVLFALGLFLLFGDVNITPELFGSQTVSKIIVFFIMLVISSFFLLYAIALCKRAKAYYTQKREFEKLAIDETDDVKIEQRTCPHCGDVHDIDYPECPKCKYKFF